MSLDTRINTGSSTVGVANVDANYNLQVNLPTTKTLAGYVVLATMNDAGAITGVKDVLNPRCSEDFRLSVGMDTAIYDDSFNSTTQNTGKWKFTSVSAMLAAQAAGFLTLNSGTQVVTSGALAALQSYRHIYLQGNTSLHLEFSIAFATANTPLAGQVMEFGLFIPPATAIAPTDGVFFRYTSAGLNGIMVNNGGTETGIATPRACSNFNIDTAYHCKMILNEDFIDFYVNNVEIGSVNVPVGFGAPFLSGALPISLIARNTALVGGTNGTALKCSDLHVDSLDMATGKTVAIIAGGMGYHGSQGQNGGTMGSTANITNNMAKGTPAILSNTTIAAPACIGLGGRAAFLPTLTVYQDGILMSYLNPVGSVNQQPRTLFIGAIRINSHVGTILAGGPLALEYVLAYGHTAVSAATAEATSFTTGGGKAPRRLPLGVETFAATAAAGSSGGPGVNVTLAAPVVINPGEYVAILVTNIGTVTTTGDIVSLIGIGSWWE